MYSFYIYGDHGWDRTNDLELRRLSLYPTELRGHIPMIVTKKRLLTQDAFIDFN